MLVGRRLNIKKKVITKDETDTKGFVVVGKQRENVCYILWYKLIADYDI